MLFRGLAWAVLLGAAFAAVVSARGAVSSTQIVFAADLRPALDGEIYRVDMNGVRVDLSRSPFADTQETVSPNGKRLAFLSVRSGSSKIYVVGTDGRGLSAVSSSLSTCGRRRFSAGRPTAHDRSTAGTSSEARIYVLQQRHAQRVIARVSAADGGIGVGAWSPDSEEFEFDSPYQTEPVVRVVARRGTRVQNDRRRTWLVRHEGGLRWWRTEASCAERARQAARIVSGRAFAWSPDGDRLASLAGQTLTVAVQAASVA